MSNRQYTAKLLDTLPSGSTEIAGARMLSGGSSRYALRVKAAGIRPPASRQGLKGRAGVLPEVFSSAEVLAARLALKAYAARKPQLYHLELTECEYLHLRAAVEHDRDSTIKAMRKGLCCPDDLKATDTLWRKLEAVMVKRMGYGRQS